MRIIHKAQKIIFILKLNSENAVLRLFFLIEDSHVATST